MARAAEARPALEDDKPAEAPLTPAELADMRQHLRFLRQHRKALHLRVNAFEDLLLNEVREPTRRGVVQHLLAKVDRAHVFRAAERLDPSAATKLAEGVLRISPNIDYLLLYLECVRRSASQEQAVAALAEALERLDFTEVSPGQMRRVLDLVVELFDPRQLPHMLLGLLQGKAFRQAFDAAAKELPDALAALVVPLRAAQAVVLHDRPNPSDPGMLQRGVELLLSGDERALARYPRPARVRLVRLGAASTVLGEPRVARTLRALTEGLAEGGDEHAELASELGVRLVALGREEHAREVLSDLVKRHPDARGPRRFLQALDGPRLGRVALVGRGAHDYNRPDESGVRRATGVHLDTTRAVTVMLASGEARAAQERLAELWSSFALPGLVPVLDVGTTSEGLHYLVIARAGERAAFILPRKQGLAADVALELAGEGVVLLAALASLGIRLPDADLRRFEIDDENRAWLADLSGAERADAHEAGTAHAELAKSLVQAVLAMPRALPPLGLLERVQASASVHDVARALAPHRV